MRNQHLQSRTSSLQNQSNAQDERAGDISDSREKAESETNSENHAVERPSIPKKKLIPSMAALYLVFFLVALDRTIIGTAIPSITADFDSFHDVAWYESAFLLPLCVLQLSFGLVLQHYSTKYAICILTVTFEIGSIICAAAPTSNALIVGRAITGIGAAGIGPGAYLFITLSVPLKDRPKFLGSLGSAFGISSILGPLLGGYLTSITWRWIFWINLPIGAVALVLFIFLAPNLPPPKTPARTWKLKLLQLDPIGFVLIASSLSCLLFALEKGKQGPSWSSGGVIALFVVFGVVMVAFIAYQVHKKGEATIPSSIIGQRTVLVSTVISFCIGSALVLYAFYLPIWFQVVQSKSPQSSGLSLLPLLLSNVTSVVASGILVSRIKYFQPFSIMGGILLVAGGALITTWTADISKGKWIGYQIITGVGLGLSLQQPAIAIQTVLKEAEIAVGTPILSFSIYLGGSVLITVAQTLFQRQLLSKLTKIAPGTDTTKLIGGTAASLKDLVSPDKLHAALVAYNDSMRVIWYLALATSAVALLASLGFEWKSIDEPGKQQGEDNGESQE